MKKEVEVEERNRNLGVQFDSIFSFEEHIKNICKSSFYHIYGLPLSTADSAEFCISVNSSSLLVVTGLCLPFPTLTLIIQRSAH